MAIEKLICSKCGREKSYKEYFKMRSGERCDLCKPCLTQYIDNRDTSTFLWILEMFDVPYIEREWIKLANKIYLKNPGKFGPSSVIGQYIRLMNMQQYQDFRFSDSDRLNHAIRQEKEQAEARRQEKQILATSNEERELQLQEKKEAGIISEAAYQTLTHTNIEESNSVISEKEAAPTLQDVPEPIPEIADFRLNENELAAQLTPEDIQYLILKWGGHYKPSEWIAMEDIYNRYAGEFDLTIDREETLKKMCRTSIKMDEALDLGDVTAYRAYSTVLKELRQSGKFTEAQAKEEKEVRYLDTIGELVQLCEQQKGIIPQFPEEEYLQDTIDLTIKDLQSYTYNLVSNELGLGDLIESYIAKLERAEDNDPLTAELITSVEQEESLQLTDTEAQEFQEWLDSGIEEDAEALLAALEGEETEWL